MKKTGRIILIVLLAAVCLSAFGGGISKVIGDISIGGGGGGLVVGGNATETPSTAAQKRRKILRYEKSVDSEPYISGRLTPDFGDVTYLTISELSAMQLAADSDATTPLYCKISTAQDLVDLSGYVTDDYYRTKNINFVQTANIDLAGKENFYLSSDENPFSGNYYGCGWKISNYSFNDGFEGGLFPYLKGATISGVFISHLRHEFDYDNNSSAFFPAGALCSYAVDSNISYCYIEDAVLTCSDARDAQATSSDVPSATAAFVGLASGKTTMKYCRVLNSTLECPAFIGRVDPTLISSASGDNDAFKPTGNTEVKLYGCVNEAEIIGAVYAAPFIGAIDENATSVTLELCTNFGDVTAKTGNRAGGMICEIGDYRKNVRVGVCINYGNISSTIHAGGLAGYYSGMGLEVSNFVNYGNISGGQNAGGLFGTMSLEYGSVLFECNVNAGEVSSTAGHAGGFFGVLNIDNDSSYGLINSGDDVRTLYNFSIPGNPFIGQLTYDGAAATDAQRDALSANNFFYHDLKVPEDPEDLRTGSDADLLFYGFLNSDGTYGFYYSGERFYPGIQTDGYWEWCEHAVAVWGYEE